MDFKLTEEQKALKKEFEAFFQEEMKGAPPEFGHTCLRAIYDSDEAYTFHRYLMKKLGEKGWLSRPWPKQYGGVEAPLIEQLIFTEVKEASAAPGVDHLGLGIFAPTLLAAATEEQKQRLLPPIARGDMVYCQGWSEPNAGSDLASLKTTAIKDGDHYVLNGQKVWTTNAHRADCMFLLARTDPDSKRSRGLSVFHLDMNQPGVEVRPIQQMNGRETYNEVFFSDAKIPEGDLIGPENEGWSVTLQSMNFERSGVGLFSIGRRVLQEIIDYTKTTSRNGKLLSEDPLVRQKIARLYVDIELGYSLAYKIIWLQQQGGMMLAASSASTAKIFGTEFLQRLVNAATEIMGLYGQVELSRWAPLGHMVEEYQTCPGMNIAGGSNEIQRNLIAWAGLGLPRVK